jgi:hypothetical protein
LDLVLELSSREMDGVAFFLFDVLLRFEGQHFREPIGDVGDDLADAGLGDLEFFGEAAGGEEFDEVEAMDFEVARGRGQGREWQRGSVGEGEIGHGVLLRKRTKNRRTKEPKAEGRRLGFLVRSVRRGVD